MDFALAVSEFNRTDLGHAGYRDVDVVPVLLDLDGFDAEVEAVPRPTDRGHARPRGE